MCLMQLNTSYLQECDEQEEGVGRPPELRVKESREEGEDVIFGCAVDRIKAANEMKGGTRRQEREKT